MLVLVRVHRCRPNLAVLGHCRGKNVVKRKEVAQQAVQGVQRATIGCDSETEHSLDTSSGETSHSPSTVLEFKSYL